jgi:hypothetical protein
MGATVNWIVDLDATLDEAIELAAKGKKWLLAQKIITTAICPERTYGGAELLTRGPLASEWDACEFQIGSAMCGLEISIGRTVYTAGDNGLQSFACPKCSHQHAPEAVPWSDAVGHWYEAEAGYFMRCTACDADSSIVDWQFLECPWGFGNLAFGFWNWTIKDGLNTELAAVLGHRCRHVEEHI